jgi:hypothetical protein
LGKIPAVPGRWKNAGLWNLAFQVLQSGRALDGLINQLVDELSRSALPLRSWKARIKSAIYDMFNTGD